MDSCRIRINGSKNHQWPKLFRELQANHNTTGTLYRFITIFRGVQQFDRLTLGYFHDSDWISTTRNLAGLTVRKISCSFCYKLISLFCCVKLNMLAP
jgi:hypothetical protein